MARLDVALLLFGIVACCTMHGSDAKNQIVGSSHGWAYPPSPTFYQDWSSKKTFVVGDHLVFPYRSGMYTLMEVSKEDFPNCTRDNVVEMFAHGPVVIELTEPGTRYFYCGVGLHCEAGMKVSITVQQTASAPAPAAPALAASSSAPAPAAPALAASSASSIGHVAAVAAVLFAYVLHALFM